MEKKVKFVIIRLLRSKCFMFFVSLLFVSLGFYALKYKYATSISLMTIGFVGFMSMTKKKILRVLIALLGLLFTTFSALFILNRLPVF